MALNKSDEELLKMKNTYCNCNLYRNMYICKTKTSCGININIKLYKVAVFELSDAILMDGCAVLASHDSNVVEIL